MELNTSSSFLKDEIFEQVRKELTKSSFIILKEEYREWGGFFVLDNNQASKFLKEFDFKVKDSFNVQLSPKLLIVEPGKRLSWQYHERRAEWWKVIGGNPGIITSLNNDEIPVKILKRGTFIELKQGERHRLIGLNDWGIIAEIWQHTDKNNLSNEEDIIRLQDDFGR